MTRKKGPRGLSILIKITDTDKPLTPEVIVARMRQAMLYIEQDARSIIEHHDPSIPVQRVEEDYAPLTRGSMGRMATCTYNRAEDA